MRAKKAAFVIGETLGFLLLASQLAMAQEALAKKSPTKEDDKDTVERLVLHPAPLPYDSLHYELTTRYLEQTPGNSATLYLRLSTLLARPKEDSSQVDKMIELLSVPLEQFPKEDARALLSSDQAILEIAQLAARRSYCDWELPLRETNVRTLIPELGELRKLGIMLALKARLEISEGSLDEALDTITTGLALGRNIAQGPTLVNDLVAKAISDHMFNQLRVLLEQPNCPNLYWTLTALPSPFIDPRVALGSERDWLAMIVPALRNVRSTKLSEADWNALLVDVIDGLKPVVDSADIRPAWESNLKALATVATAYPLAKDQLHDAGYTQKQIDAMCPAQAILIGFVETTDRLRDEIHQWSFVALPEALEGLKQAEQNFDHAKPSDRYVASLMKQLVPATRKARIGLSNTEREIAVLRCVEAVRLYAAGHDGRLPNQLADISEVPIPIDPSTGKAFSYVVKEENRVLLIAASPDGDPKYELRWELKMASKK